MSERLPGMKFIGRRRTSWVVAVTLGCALTASGCTSAADLYPKARCSDEVLADTKHDAPKITALAPEGLSDVDGRFYKSAGVSYLSECFISEEKGKSNFLTGRAVYHSGMEHYPSKSPKKFFTKQNFKGTSRNITSAVDAVEGVSGRGSAGVWAPCSMEKSTGFSPGAMVATISASSAPDGGSVKQRQNAADLALSLLRYAVKHCDEPPALPKRVTIAR